MSSKFDEIFDPIGTLDTIGDFSKARTGTNMMTGQDPLVLDLDRDGIELTTENYVTGKYFDLLDTGFAELAA